MKDLVILAADKDAQQCLLELLGRQDSLAQFGIGPFTFEVVVHPLHDPGCRIKSAEVIGVLNSTYHYAAVLFDREGCGDERTPIAELEASVVAQLEAVGWAGRSAAFIVDPEIENWIWTNHDRMARVIDWVTAQELRNWLETNDWQVNALNKPVRPKESFRQALRAKRVQLSASLFGEIAEGAPLSRCKDPAFLALMHQLASWFPLGKDKHGQDKQEEKGK